MTPRTGSPAPRIAYVAPGFPPTLGGVERHVAELAVRAARAGWAVEVLAQDGERRPTVATERGVTIRRFPSIVPSKTFPFAPGLFAHLRRHQGDWAIVHAHNYHSLPALGAALTRHGRLVFTPHYLGSGDSASRRLLHGVYARPGRLIFERAAHVICVTQTEAGAVQESFGVAQSRISVIPNGIDVDAIRAGEPFPTDSLVVLSAGRLESYKNVDLAVRALAHLDDRFVLAVAGDGPARAALEALAANLGLTPRVRFLGRLDSATLNRWYRTARVYVSMSGRECFGITLLEALAAGASVVAADTPVHREVLASVAQANVELVPTGSPAPALADALRSAALRRRATGATRPLSWDDVASRTLDVYSSLLGSPGQASAA